MGDGGAGVRAHPVHPLPSGLVKLHNYTLLVVTFNADDQPDMVIAQIKHRKLQLITKNTYSSIK